MEKQMLENNEITQTKAPKYFTNDKVIFLNFLPFILFGLLITSFVEFGSSGGEYNIVSSVPSPDGKNVVIFYAGAGGGAAGWTFCRATIIPADEQFDPKEHQDYVFDIKGGNGVETVWEGNENLLIVYKYKPEKTNPYLRVSREIYSRRTGVNIRYVEKTE